MGRYDRTMKLLVESNPEAMARFVLHEWQKQRGIDGPELQVIAVTLLSEEFQPEELKGDGVWLLEGPDGLLSLVSIEYQSALDSTMPLRSLEYLARAKKKHGKTYRDLPVIAVVIYLFDEEGVMPLQKKALAAFRQMVIGLVSQRFPTLLRLAKAQIHLLKQPEDFQAVVLGLSLARDVDEAQNVLLALNENAGDEEGQ